MARIDIRRTHSRSVPDARAAIDRLAEAISDEFQLQCKWTGDTLQFTRSGVDGCIALADGEVRVTAELGFLMGAFKPLVEREIERHLDEQLA